jgi:hypothetical protein
LVEESAEAEEARGERGEVGFAEGGLLRCDAVGFGDGEDFAFLCFVGIGCGGRIRIRCCGVRAIVVVASRVADAVGVDAAVDGVGALEMGGDLGPGFGGD